MSYLNINKPTFPVLTNIACLLFFMMLVFPYLFMEIKVVFIIVIIMFFFGKGISKSINSLMPRYRKWIFIYSVMSIIYFVYGILNGNPGIYNFLLTYLIWPLLYFVFCTLIDEFVIRRIFKTMYFAYIVIIIIGIISFLQGNGFIPNIINMELWNIDTGDRPLFDFGAIFGGFVVSFIFLFPFFITMYVVDNEFSKSLLNKVLTILSFIFVFATSRRAIIMSVFYLPFLIYFFYKQSIKITDSGLKKSVVKNMIILFGVPILLVAIFSISLAVIDLNQFLTFITAAFDTNSDDFGNERSEQAVSLINGWFQNPFFGAGPGVDVDVVRSDIPGKYELTYLAILFSRGLFGFVIYVLQFLLLLKWGVKLSALTPTLKSYFVAYNVAFFSFLISNGSNPYLDAYDHLWILFLYISFQSIVLKMTYEKG